MRKILADFFLDIGRNENVIFLTGDLGFRAFEGVRDVMKEKFINTGVAEQSMISMAAGMAYRGYDVFCYSIAPFITYRCLEQIRNDICFHNLPVYLVGNGGGYGYGIMGSTHHAIEDIAIVSGLPNMHCYIPSFGEDVTRCLVDIIVQKKPAYLRLGLAKPNPFSRESQAFFNALHAGKNPKVTIIGTGIVMHAIFDAVHEHHLGDSVDIFNIIKLPYGTFTKELIKSIQTTQKVLVAEEHISIGGLGQRIAHDILTSGIKLRQFKSLCAAGYPGSKYGSQQYHLRMSGLDRDNIFKVIHNMTHEHEISWARS